LKPLLNGMFFDGMPPVDRPVYLFDNGIANRATTPEADNLLLGTPGATFAFRRVARDAIGVEKGMLQNNWKLPPEFDAVEQPVVLDFEFHPSIDAMYSEQVEDAERAGAALRLAGHVLGMKEEAAFYGKTLLVGAYHPIRPYANDPAAMKAGERDWKPYLDSLDFAAPEAYLQSRDMQKWSKDTKFDLDRCARLMPGKPVYPVVTPFYMDRAPEAIRHKLIPMLYWKEMVGWLLGRKQVAGLVGWGGVKFRDNPDGSNRLPWADVEPHWTAAREAAERN